MAQIQHGLRAVLARPEAYRLWESVTGALRARGVIVREHVRPKPGDRVLDIGCGPGEIVSFLPGTTYTGFDENPSYIRDAQRRFGDRASFSCERVEQKTLPNAGAYDVVLAFGVLHHLDDDSCVSLFQLASHALRPGGRLVTLDGCYAPSQSPLAHFVVSRDRGQNVRYTEEYVELARRVFDRVDARIHDGLMRIPYTLAVLECTK